MDICRHLWTACVRQLLPDLAQDSVYVVACDLTFLGIPVVYLKSLTFLKSSPPSTISFSWDKKMHKHL